MSRIVPSINRFNSESMKILFPGIFLMFLAYFSFSQNQNTENEALKVVLIYETSHATSPMAVYEVRNNKVQEIDVTTFSDKGNIILFEVSLFNSYLSKGYSMLSSQIRPFNGGEQIQKSISFSTL